MKKPETITNAMIITSIGRTYGDIEDTSQKVIDGKCSRLTW
jgi:hypothetical protein